MITREIVAEHLEYDEESGELYWIKRPSNNSRVQVGDVFGSVTEGGYVTGGLLCKRYAAHRLIFLLKTGRFPECVDHIDRDKLNNRWANLREASFSLNMRNRDARNELGVKNVYPYDTRFRARGYKDGKTTWLGIFETLEEASAAVEQFNLEHGVPM